MSNFIGRNNEIKILETIALKAGTGNSDSIFLSGKRGIGKTKLIKQLFSHLFEQRKNVIPFLYTIKTAFVSIENFSRNYLGSFILQSLAYKKNNVSIIDAGIYSLEDIRKLASDSEMDWAVEIIDDFFKIASNSTPVNMFMFAISAPNMSYQKTGIPVIVMIDDFHKIRKFCENNADDINSNFWMFYENVIQTLYTPHVFTGLEAELNEMFYEETSFGDLLEVINVSGLDKENYLKLFSSLCEAYGLKTDAEPAGLIEILGGNPFYMKNVLQAARQRGGKFAEEDFWLVYLDEVLRGKTYKYWTSQLKKYVQQFELRKPSLRFLYHLSGSNADVYFENPEELFSVETEKLERIINLLNFSGTIESGFSEIRLAEDRIMSDVLKGLYYSEIMKDNRASIKDKILGEKNRIIKSAAGPETFEVKIPSAPGAELVAVKSLEQIALHFNVLPEIVGQLQLALIELIANGLSKDGPYEEGCQLTFMLEGNMFHIETMVAQTGFDLKEENRKHILTYLDDLRVETLINGTKIVFIKEI